MKKILYSICLILSLATVSCANLDLNPLSEGSSNNWYSSQEELEMSLSDLYRRDFFPIDDIMWADDFPSRGSTTFTQNSSLTATNGTVANWWANYYKGISRCLKLISKLDNAREMGLSESTISQYEGEAYFYIGMAYGMIAFRWGDAVLYKDVISLEDAYTISRSPKSEILSYAYECLDKAAKQLPNSRSTIQRATKGMALAFKARIAIYNGDYATAASAAKECMDLGVYKLHDNYETLFTDSWSDEWIFFFKGDVALKQYYWASAQPKDLLPRNHGGYSSWNPGLELVCTYTCTDGLPIDESPLYNPKSPFDNRDPRMGMTIIPFATLYTPCVVDGTYKPEDWAFLGIEFTPDPTRTTVKRLSDGVYIGNNDSKARAEHAAYNGFVLKKFTTAAWKDNGYNGAPNAYPYLRYGDVLLMYAEAMIETGKCTQDVLDQTVNKLRERAYRGTGIAYPRATVSTQEKMRTMIRIERTSELAIEGHRYEDLIRWRIAEVVFNRPIYYLSRAWSGSTSWNGDESKVSDGYKQLIQNWRDGNYPIGGIPPIDENGIADLKGMCDAGYIVKAADRKFNPDRDYLWPIPESDILVDSNLVQNPGY
ncbi:MAG: RagB/SusD family nutrient uptake outer membrane protein [Bacteroidales bacterium]|nr:RagB/SusD family nutrient uptake outer membrane protein [Bacteroidales bacterium]